MGPSILRGICHECFRLSLAAAAALLFATAAHAYSDEAVKDGEALVQLAKDRYAAGEGTAAEIARAQVFLLHMKFEAGQIQRAAYCQSVMPDLQSVVREYESEMRVGQRTLEEVIDVKSKLYEFKAFCQKG